MKKLGIYVVIIAMLLAGCAATKIENIVRSQQSIGKIETLAMQIETGFVSAKEGTKLKQVITNELQKNGIRAEAISDISLGIEIDDFQIPSAPTR
jgi:uncharacterized protein YcfL